MKSRKPTSAGQRQTLTIDYRKLLTRTTPEKSLTVGQKRHVGRNNLGRITTRHKGGGNKRNYRLVDFTYNKHDIPAKIDSIEYDPNRSAFIGLAIYADGEKRYVVLPKNMKVGDKFIVSEKAPIETGNRLPFKSIPAGTYVYNIEIKPGAGAKIVRSAGAFAQVVAQNEGYTQLKLPSSEIRRVQETCWATIGTVSNDENKLVRYGKAGRSRWMGIRPTVRGTAMNPVDHPYGGGEGVQGRGTKRPKTLWGKVTGGRKTRTPKKYSNQNVISRRKVGKK
ncbi:MAG: 50S ribosomal protein L2 [Candidatus Pacebacteria bacterium]|nr:50S ribosomal protein L2 [Candidatus Paceibacterota bacterium]MBP9700969.1 50S ribosomal protein L2 [Candidatus Paceibacterota bacterium]